MPHQALQQQPAPRPADNFIALQPSEIEQLLRMQEMGQLNAQQQMLLRQQILQMEMNN